jgi:hypothetical protein
MVTSRVVGASSVLFVLILGIAVTPTQGQHLPDPGVEVEFVVPNGSEITAGTEGDIVIFTGRSQGTVDIGDCANGGFLQTATVVDPGDGRATRLSYIVLTHWSDRMWIKEAPPAPAGTRVGNLVHLGSCASTAYNRYRGVVQ